MTAGFTEKHFLADRREIQKNKLKQNLIDSDAQVELRERRSAAPFVIAFIALIAVAALFFRYRQENMLASGYETVWDKETSGSGAALTFRGYCGFNGGIITYTKDGAEYTDENGNSVWQRSYQMNNPSCDVNGSFAVIFDRGGTQYDIFSVEQCTGTGNSVLPISLARVSGKGVVYTVQNDDDADYISVYKKDGTQIDLTVKSVVNGDGYPFDIAVSPDGSQLLTSYISVADGVVTESVVFRNFGEIGQNEDARRVVGGFMDEFEGHIVTMVGFSGETYAHAVYDGGIVFFSTKVLNSPEVIKNVEISEEMLAVASGESGVAVIVNSEGEEHPRKVIIFDNEGNISGSGGFDIPYEGFHFTGSNVIINSSDRILEYNLKGTLIADISFDGKLSYVSRTSKQREFITAESGKLCRIKGGY